ncbi:hypothetical protein BH09BAC2_BH09BAC2_06490 [soil metagenome]
MNAANEYTGKISERYNNIQTYFFLKRTNDSLIKANENLYNKLRQDFEVPDSLSKTVIDTINVDSLKNFRKYEYLYAKVIGNSVGAPNNYIQLSRGDKQGMERDLGVIDLNGNVVGTVIDLSENYSVVMSLLHQQSTISVKHKKSGVAGNITWDGITPNQVSLNNIPKGVKMSVGDSIVTSGFTDRFPYGLFVGRISDIELDKNTNIYVVKLRTAVDFYNVQYGYAIKNIKKEELQNIMKRVKKANE